MTQDIQKVLDAFYSMYPGIDPFGSYCQFTGKAIGINSEVVDFIESSNDDIEEIADDLALRIFASMRPSIRWNKMRQETLDEMRRAEPIQTLAYLLNRAFTPKAGDILAVHYDRIKTYLWCEQQGVNESTATLMYHLLEIDAKIGLTDEWPTFTLNEVLSVNSPESMNLLLSMVEAWRDRRVKAYEAKLKAAELSSRWWRSGNALAKPAFFSAWQEQKPVTPTQEKKLAKKAEQDFFAGILFEITGGGIEANAQEAEAARPKPTKLNLPSTKMPLKFGKKQG